MQLPHGCNCQFGGFPNEGKCEGIFGTEVKEGRFGSVSLNGLRAAIIFKYPKAIHEGNGHVVLFVDDRASREQVDAFATILSGKMGGMPWEALAGTIACLEGPIRKPIEITVAGERSSVRVPDAIEMRLTPLKNPITGEDKEVHTSTPKAGSSGTTAQWPRRRGCEGNTATCAWTGQPAALRARQR